MFSGLLKQPFDAVLCFVNDEQEAELAFYCKLYWSVFSELASTLLRHDSSILGHKTSNKQLVPDLVYNKT